MDTSGKRNTYLDFLKSVAIILVIVGHSIQYGSGSQYLSDAAYYDNIIFKVIYSFHMPLFMLISGYLFAFSVKKQDWTKVIRSKIKSLLVPIWVWGLTKPMQLVLSSLYRSSPVSGADLVKEYIDYTIYSLWFLWAVLFCSICVAIVRRFLKDNVWIYLAGFGLTFFIPDILHTQLYRFMYPYFVVGYFYGKEEHHIAVHEPAYKTNLRISGILFAVLLLFFNEDSYIYTSGYCILKNDLLRQLGIDLYRFGIGFVGSIFVILGMKPIYDRCSCKLISAFSLVGKDTMGIYIISNYIFLNTLPVITVSLTEINYFWVLVESIIIFAVSFALTKMIKKIPILRRLLLGAR